MVGIKKIGLYLLVLLLMASLNTPSAYAVGGSTADLILYNGIVVTMDQDRSRAEAVAIKADKILAVGTNEKIKTFAGYGTKIIDLQGKMVIPGLVDSHFHLSRAANEVHGVDLNHAESIEDVIQAISKRVEMTLKGEWVVAASNWHEGALKEGRLPNKMELDPVSPDNPVLIPRGGHVITVNSVALDLSGITKDTPNPEGGIIVKDSKTGEPTGVIIGQPATELVKNLLPKQTSEDKVKALEEMMHKVNEYGITSITDPAVLDGEIESYMELWKNGKVTTRSTLLRRVNTLEDVKKVSDQYTQGYGDDFLTIGGLKYYSDGGVETSYLKEPHQIVPGEQEDPHFHGQLRLPPGGMQELEDMFHLAAEKGWSLGTHAVGDWSIEEIVNLYAKVNDETPIRDLRWVIMHIFLPTDESIEKMKKVGIMATVQDHPVLLGHNQLRYHGDERANAGIPIRKLIDSGIVLGGGTDAPVNPSNPFISLWWMNTRNTFTAGVLGQDQAISREEALYLFTMGSAITQFKDDKVGSLEPGKLADLAILSDNYFNVPDEKIKDIESLLTIVGGNIVHQDSEIELLLPLRESLESMGAEVAWDGATQTVTVKKGEGKLVLSIGSDSVKLNEELVPLTVPARIFQSRSLVPSSFIKYLEEYFE